MPTSKEHRARAEQNEFFVSTLDNPFWDWAVAGTFYAALHYIDAFFRMKDIDPGRHYDRNDKVEHDPTLSKIWPNYKQLYQDSRLARYELYPFGKNDVKYLIDNELKPIKDLVVPLLPK